MNNSNDSPRGQGAGDGDGSLWNYIPLAHMLGLALIDLFWNKPSQRKIQKLKAQHDKDVSKTLAATQEVREAWYQQATATLKKLEGQLMERQNIYCSFIKSQDQRLEMEKDMLLQVVKDPISSELDLESDLKDIFKRDKQCAYVLNTDKRKNGSLMWVYLKYWHQQIDIQKHKRAEEAILGGKIQSHTK